MAAIAGASVLLTLGIVVLPAFASLSAELLPDQARQLATQVAVYAALAVAAATVIAWIGAGRFARGMVELTQQSDRVAQGMLRQDLLYESDDEVGQLANSFREMTRGLRTVVTQLDAGASDVAKTAEELAASAQQMQASTHQVSSAAGNIADAAAAQTRGVTNASAASSRVASRAVAVASHAEQARNAADVAQRTTRRGTIAAGEALLAMAEISV